MRSSQAMGAYSKTESIDVHDACGSNIRVDVKGSEVVRVLPVLNEEINEEWIGDKTRFSYDGLVQQRLDRPYVKKNGKFEEISWNQVIEVIGENLKANIGRNIAALAGDLADVESMYILKKLMQQLGSGNYDCRPKGSVMQTNFRSDYLFNTEIQNVDNADLVLLIGVNPRSEAAIINNRILKAVNHNNCKVGYVGEEIKLNYEAENLGSNGSVLEQIARGDHDFAKKLNSAKNPIIIVGEGALCRADSSAIMKFAKIIAEKYNVINSEKFNFNILHNAAGRVGGLDLGFYPSKSNMDTAEILKKGESGNLDVLILLGYDNPDIKNIKNTITIYIGSHGDNGAQVADIILPSAYGEIGFLY